MTAIALPSDTVAIYADQSLSDLLNSFNKLSVVLDSKDNEMHKLAILRRLEKEISDKFIQPIQMIATTSANQIEEEKSALQQSAYYVCAVFGFLQRAAGGYLFSSSLFALIPGITYTPLAVLVSLYIVLDNLLFYAFEIAFLRKYFQRAIAEKADASLNEVYAEQLEVTEHIYKMLDARETTRWPSEDYKPYLDCLIAFKTDLCDKQARMGEYVRSPLKRGIESGLLYFGVFTSIADSYFMVKMTLLALHLTLMSSPFCWIFAVGILLSSSILYYAMTVKSMSKMINPDMKSHRILKGNLTLFKENYGKRQPYFDEKPGASKTAANDGDTTEESSPHSQTPDIEMQVGLQHH
ncbi:MAG: hypothetical protein NXI01_06060 [Gammaproteobacteria bacterium]|nr:hypothetical protein [Gammaproteobacteria bacterium]